MGLVSSIYRMAPSDTWLSAAESKDRLGRILQRLVNTHGEAEVLRRVRVAPVSQADAALKPWIMLTVFGMDRQRQGSMTLR